MNSTFLQELERYFKENNLIIPALYVSRKRLPAFFRKAIDNYLAYNTPNARPDDYVEFGFDSNGNFVMIATYNMNKNRIVIHNDRKDIIKFEDPNYRYAAVDINHIISGACKIGYNYKLVNDIKAKLEGLDDHQKAYYARAIRDMLMGEEYGLYGSINPQIIEEELSASLPIIEAYASYINDEYLHSKEEHKEQVVYYESNEIFHEKKGRPVSKSPQVERKNEIIPIEDRLSVLASFGPLDQIEAICTSNEDHYYCFLYPTGLNEYRMIAEPVNGNRQTRVFSFVAEGIDKSQLLSYAVTKYLPLTHEETLYSNFAIRSNHTTMPSFKNTIGFIITLDDKSYKTGPYIKDSLLLSSPDKLTIEENQTLN